MKFGKFLIPTLTIFFAVACFFPGSSIALEKIRDEPGLGCELINGDVPSLGCLVFVIANAIGIAEMFIGAVALIFLLYGSILFITSRGDPKAVEKAKKTMTYAIFGVVAIFGIFIVSNIIATSLGLPNPLSRFSLYVP